ncbi:hypothetical protein [Nocardioides hungaricus]
MWGSWRAPCRAKALDLAAVANETATRGVRFAGLDVRDSPAPPHRHSSAPTRSPTPATTTKMASSCPSSNGIIPLSPSPRPWSSVGMAPSEPV